MPHAGSTADERIVPGTAEWDASYPDHIQRYRFALDYVSQGATVLDAGCGVGYGAAEVADNRGARVLAVDIADDALALARQHFDRAAITWCRDDCQALTKAAAFAPFDVVINFENIEHLERPELFVSRTAELLRRDGILLTSTPNRLLLNRLRGVPAGAPSANPHHLNELSEDEFRTLLEQHFGRVEILYQCPAGAARFRLWLRYTMARLRIRPVLTALRRMMRRIGTRDGATRTPVGYRAIREWSIEKRDHGAAWTLIAVCRDPRRTKLQM